MCMYMCVRVCVVCVSETHCEIVWREKESIATYKVLGEGGREESEVVMKRRGGGGNLKKVGSRREGRGVNLSHVCTPTISLLYMFIL